MKLATLKNILKDVTGTDIKAVYFDWKEVLNVNRTKEYPAIFWVTDNAGFAKDARTSTIQKVKTIKFPVFVIGYYNPMTDDKIAVWDSLEDHFDAYINHLDSNARIEVANINDMKGDYVPEKLISADNEIGIMFKEATLKCWCNG